MKKISIDPILGHYIETGIGYSTNKINRESGASGGIIGEIVSHLFETNKIDGALSILPDGNYPNEYKIKIAENFEMFSGSQGSHYFPIPLMDGLNQIIYGKFRSVLVIGIPCQIAGFHLGSKRIQKLKNRTYATIGSFCGGTTTFKLLEYLKSRLPKNKQNKLKTIRFRDGNWPGNIKAEFDDNTISNLSGEERDYHQFTALLPACAYCADHSNEYADISVGDPWLQEILDRRDGGYSVYVARTNKGLDLIQELRDQKKIFTEYIEPSKVTQSQRGPLDFKKRGLKPRIALRWLFPSKIPTILGPRIMKSDFLDYINAFILLILLRVAKLKIFWRLYFLFPSKFVALINKPINFLQKRYNLLQRILKKIKINV